MTGAARPSSFRVMSEEGRLDGQEGAGRQAALPLTDRQTKRKRMASCFPDKHVNRYHLCT